MASEEAAITMVDYYNPSTAYLRSQPVHIQYSNHRELKTDNLPNQAGAQAALQAVNAVQSGNLPATGDLAPEGQGSVIRIIIENLICPVSLDVLHQIFSKFGCVLKIITFTKNNQFQVLLQYAEPKNAYHAKMALDGQTVFSAHCTLHIDFSRLSSLTVKYNNDKSRDFTRPDLPFDDGQPPTQLYAPDAFGTPNTIFPSYAGTPGLVPHTGFPQGVSVPPFHGAAGSFTFIPPGSSGQMTTPSFSAVPLTSVLLVSNLNLEAITPYGLFILFGVYGDVLRVKIMFKKKGNALVQMADATQAQLAISYLNGQRLYGRVLHATFSKHHTVQLPHEREEDQGLTKDYTNSPLHRFKKPGSKNFRNIFPPSATLHLSNMPPSVTADDVMNLFANTGFTVRAFRFFPKSSKMALIQLDSVEEAVHAVIELHNHELGKSHHLRISFSKSKI